jgi:transposase
VERLATLVREQMKPDPFSGAVYVFRAKRADRVKLIFCNGTEHLLQLQLRVVSPVVV